MSITVLILVTISATFGICSVVLLALRRISLGAAFGGAFLGSLTLGYVAAAHSDPPSLLPLWGWCAGMFLGAAPGLAAWLVIFSGRRDTSGSRDHQDTPGSAEGR